MLGRISRYAKWRVAQFVNHTLVDWRYGIETRKVEKRYLQEISSESVKYSEFYATVPWKPFARIIEQVPVDYSQYTFLDAGSGKGRALIFATRYNFKRILGVELSEKLHAIAEEDIQSFKARTKSEADIRLICANITDFCFPDEDLLIFVNNPFNGEVMKTFLDNVHEFCKAHGRKVYIAYRSPLCVDLFEARPEFVLIAEGHAFKIYEHSIQYS